MDEAKKNLSKNTTIEHYLALKKEYNDCLLLYRIGDFYEAFFDDAILFSKICDITLTKRKYNAYDNVALSGVPKKSLEIYLKKLLNANIKVARCEQFKKPDGSIERRVVRVYTKGTLFEGEFLDNDKNSYLLSVFKLNEKYGLSFCDCSTGSFFLTCGEKKEVEREIFKISPSEILFPSQEFLFEFTDVIEDLKNVTICPELFINSPFEPNDGFFKAGYISANAIFNYLSKNQKEFLPRPENIQKYTISDFLSLDINTRKNLELLRMRSDLKKEGSLFWLLDNTKTPMGRRLLREYINSPLYVEDKILKRRGYVGTILENSTLLCKIENFLEDFCDILRLSSKIANKTISPKEFYEMGFSLKKVKEAKDIFLKFGGEEFSFDEENFKLLCDFSDILLRTFDFESDFDFETLPVKCGANAKLDLLRAQLQDLKTELSAFESAQKAINPDVKIKSSAALGYFFEIPINQIQNIPQDAFIKQKMATSVRFSNSKLTELEEKIYSLRQAISDLERDIFKKLKEYSQELTSNIRQFANLCARLDVYYSLAKCAIENNFCMPKINAKGVFELKEARHPCVEKICKNFCSNDTKNFDFAVITGANMSGKSTYLKQNAIIAILNQMGAYVPALSANLTLFDKIFFHSSTFDNFKQGESTFMAEMKMLAMTLENATNKSFILLDEPIKGTNNLDSLSLLRAVCEYIDEELGAKTVIATHYYELARKMKNKAELMCFEVEKRKIKSGISLTSNAYEVAHSAGIKQSIIDRAKGYSKD